MFEKICNIFSKENIIDIFAILISIYNIYFTVKQEKKAKIAEVNNYWFRNYVRNFIENVKNETTNLLNNTNKDYFEFLMSLKKISQKYVVIYGKYIFSIKNFTIHYLILLMSMNKNFQILKYLLIKKIS